MGILDDIGLITSAEVDSERAGKPIPKGVPTVVAKAEKKITKEKRDREFRQGVWKRDKSKSRATGKPLDHSGVDSDRVGEVHHVLARSTNPDRVYDVSNGILISRTEHQLAEAMCPNAPGSYFLEINGPEDRGQPQTFIWRDKHGKELRRRVG